MAILTEKVVWRRKRPQRERVAAFKLTKGEQENVKAALRELRRRFGSWEALADAMGCNRSALKKAAREGDTEGKRPSPGMALAAARLAGVPVELLLASGLE